MTAININIFKVEDFLFKNLKEVPVGDGKYNLKAECSIIEFLEKFEKAMEE